jgi:hypothetical protein
MTIEEATHAMHHSILRLLGMAGSHNDEQRSG